MDKAKKESDYSSVQCNTPATCLCKVYCAYRRARNLRMEARKKFEDVCLSLNMDSETADSAWALYQKIDEDYGLEVRARN